MRFTKWIDEKHSEFITEVGQGFQHPDAAARVPVPLKKGEKHCQHCGGYGEHPVNKQDPRQTIARNKCGYCDGSGKA